MTKHSNPAVRMNWSAVLVSVLLGVLLFFGVFYLSNTSPAEAKSYPIVRSCQGLTVKQVGKNWVTVKKSNGSRVNYTGVAENSNGWWRVVGGVVDFKYTGIAQNDYGWWRIVDGKVDFNADGVFQNFHGWWKVENGKVDFGYNGFADNENGTWLIRNGKVDFGYGGLYMTEDGVWHYIENGKVLPNYEGLIANNYGAWYVKDGTVQFGFTGTYQGYSVQTGKVSGKSHYLHLLL